MWKDILRWGITLARIAVMAFGLELGMALVSGQLSGRPLLCDAHLQLITGSALMILGANVYCVMTSGRLKDFLQGE